MARHAADTGAHEAHRYLPRIGNALLWTVVLVAAYFLWPVSLGGQTGLVIVSGRSMEPTYFDGDLVVARTGEPQVGDVIVYKPAGYGGAQVVHRIIGGDSTAWVIQGDNNAWIDPFETTNADIVGIVQYHIPHVGVVGKLLVSPMTWIFVLLGAVALIIWPDDRRRHDDPEDSRESQGAWSRA